MLRYFSVLILPLIIQGLSVLLTVEANTGNGSWLGLGAVLVGMFAIPATLVVNFLFVKNHPQLNGLVVLLRCLLHALVVPVVMVFLFAVA